MAPLGGAKPINNREEAMQVSVDVMSVLDRAIMDGNQLSMTHLGQLDRKLYTDVNKVLEAAGGKWDRKAKAHVFGGNAAAIIEPIIATGEYRNVKQDLGQFDSPPAVVKRVMAAANIAPSHTVLEPSAGIGALALAALGAGATVMCIELDVGRAAKLVAVGLRSVIQGVDFLSMDALKPVGAAGFDRVIMNPPFAGQVDIDHVRHASKFVRSGGRLVAVMSAGTMFRENAKAAGFRDFVAALSGTIEWLPDDAFAPSGTQVKTCLVSFDVR